MRKCLLILIILSIILISGCTQTIGPVSMATPCSWVYKTNGDYFNLMRANLGYDEKGNEVIGRIGELHKTKLKNGYIHEGDICSQKLGWTKPTNVAFLSKTVAEWDQETVACDEEKKTKRLAILAKYCPDLPFKCYEPDMSNEIIIKKCGEEFSKAGTYGHCDDFKFNVSVCYTEIGGKRCNFNLTLNEAEITDCIPCDIAEGVSPGSDVIHCSTNGIECDYTMNEQEGKAVTTCEGHKYSIDMVIDRDPFTELYFCNEKDTNKINDFITNNQLDTECEKII